MNGLNNHGPGLIGIASATMSRYSEFHECVYVLQRPQGSNITPQRSVNVARNYNRMCQIMLNDTRYQWLWILGDDHVFHSDLLMKLLSRDVDIVVPLCLRRTPPYHPVINDSFASGHLSLDDTFIQGKSGMVDIGDKTCGNAGMLIKRRVIEKLKSDWHRSACNDTGTGGPDIWFCKRAQENGFKIYIDTDNPIGHVCHMGVFPVRDKDNNYKVRIAPPMDMPPGETNGNI